jgi:hypothetical protein
LIEFLKRELKKSYHFNYLNRKNENKNFKSWSVVFSLYSWEG